MYIPDYMLDPPEMPVCPCASCLGCSKEFSYCELRDYREREEDEDDEL